MANNSNEERSHVKLPKLRTPDERECWVTMLHDFKRRVDIVIGAGTRAACVEAFRRISYGAPVDDSLVYYAAWRKLDITGYGFACFRAAALSALEQTP
jgi:hypothetical protein